MTHIHRSLANGTVELTAPWKTGPATSRAVWQIEGTEYEFTSGQAQLSDWFLENYEMDDFQEEYRLEQGRLRIARSLMVDPEYAIRSEVALACWDDGGEHVVLSAFHSMPSSQVIDIWRRFDWLDSPEGPEMMAINSSVGATRSPDVAVVLSDRGIIESLLLNDYTRARLPSWRGRQAGRGEVFREDNPQGGRHYVYASESDHVLCYLVTGEDLSDSEATDFFSEAQPAWRFRE